MNIEELRQSGLIIFEGITGSQAYGTATPSSDIDKRGVFIQPLDAILKFKYQEQIADETNDVVFYEISKFLELLSVNNPTILELLNLPEDCIIQKTEIFDEILKHKDKFISKQCKFSFGEYAAQQIKKARGMNKKIVKPMEKQRKSVLEFCFLSDEVGGSISLISWLKKHKLKQEDCGLVSLPHMRYVYAIYHDSDTTFKGIVQDELSSNDVSLSSIPKGLNPIGTMYFNKDGYSIYCKEYKEYWEWVEKRNPHRFSDNMIHGKGYDGKNIAHCHRLLDMAIEIAEGKGINIRRKNIEELLSIRRGEKEYDDLIIEAENKVIRMEQIFSVCDLPEYVDKSFCEDLLVRLRKQFYKI